MSAVRPAGFWIRALAFVIDVLVLALVDGSFTAAGRRLTGTTDDSAFLHGITTLFTLIFAAVYVTVLHAAGGQTVGKLVVRAHVVMLDGEPVPVGVSLLRFFAYFASCVTLGLGYLMAGLRRDKRALHDLIAGTRVERRLPERKAPEGARSEHVTPEGVAPAPAEPTDVAVPSLEERPAVPSHPPTSSTEP
jgi:uncharacterized RDD family membrane protein YckC